MMQNEKTISFDKLPEAVGYLTEQVIELKKMVSELKPPSSEKREQVIELKKMVSELKPSSSEKRVLIEIEDACRIIHKAKATVYTLVRKGILPAYKKGKKLYFYEDELLAWVENGRKKTSEQNYDEILANMQSGMRRKPKSRTNF